MVPCRHETGPDARKIKSQNQPHLTTPPKIINANDMQEDCKLEFTPCCPQGTCKSRLDGVIRKSGGRMTKERDILLRNICDIGDTGHTFTPESLLQKLEQKGVEVALTTIYRNLPPLLQAGIIRKVDPHQPTEHGTTVYEHIWGRQLDHQLVCTQCSDRIPFKYPALDILNQAIAVENGYELVTQAITLVGLCARCQQQSTS